MEYFIAILHLKMVCHEGELAWSYSFLSHCGVYMGTNAL